MILLGKRRIRRILCGLPAQQTDKILAHLHTNLSKMGSPMILQTWVIMQMIMRSIIFFATLDSWLPTDYLSVCGPLAPSTPLTLTDLWLRMLIQGMCGGNKYYSIFHFIYAEERGIKWKKSCCTDTI